MFENDIPLTIAQRAYNGVSWSPEARGAHFVKGYAEHLADRREAIVRIAHNNGRTEDDAAAAFDQYHAIYKARALEYLSALSNTVSAYIAGPSNFNTRRAERTNRTERTRLDRMLGAWDGFYKVLARKWDIRSRGEIRASDPDAIEQLRAELLSLAERQARMKEVNAAIRKGKTATEKLANLAELGIGQAEAVRLLTPDSLRRVGYPDYALKNNGANMRRIEQRITQIENLRALKDEDLRTDDGITIQGRPQENRIRIYFPGKPDEATRNDLKRNGFRWAPSEGAWSGYYNYNCRAFAAALLKAHRNAPPATP